MTSITGRTVQINGVPTAWSWSALYRNGEKRAEKLQAVSLVLRAWQYLASSRWKECFLHLRVHWSHERSLPYTTIRRTLGIRLGSTRCIWSTEIRHHSPGVLGTFFVILFQFTRDRLVS